MNKEMTEKKEFSYEEFNNKNHRFGRLFLATALILIIMVPVVICIVLDTLPDFGLLTKGLIALIIFIIGGFVEVMTYGPMIGTSATYLSFFTGNLVNLKIPCAMNARDVMKVKHGSPEGEIVSTVAIATSTIITTLVIALGVLLMHPLLPVLESPVLSPAFEMSFTALFGAMAYKYSCKDWRLVPLPLILTVVLQILTHMGKTVLIPISAILTILFAYRLFKKDNADADN